MNTIQAVIFDFFDVIHSDVYLSWLHANGLEREGPYRETPNLLDTGQLTMDQFFIEIGKISGKDPASIRKHFHEKGNVDTQMIDLIHAVHTHYPTALLSNASGSFLRPLLEEYDLYSAFDHVVISGEVGLMKPDKPIFDHALKLLGVRAQEAVFIDDNETNISQAISYGINGVHYTGNIVKLRTDLARLGITLS